LAGLLPENAEVRRRMADSLNTAPGTVSLLAAMGWDCPGAVQITPPEALDAMLARASGLVPVDERWIGSRLTDLDDPTAVWALPEEHWSLPGQQGKLALTRTDSGWAEATGSAPTTHIVKPGISALASQALTEHATMRAAAAMGVDVAETSYTEFDGRPAIVVTRFDRVPLADGRVLRLHQEDMCQAVGRMPDRKYEEHGGPGIAEMAAVLRTNSRNPRPEIERLTDFLLVNYAVAAPDGHAKNVSIRILPNGNVGLAPLYDLASGLPYDKQDVDRKIALSIGGERFAGRIHGSQWARAARQLGVEEDRLRERARTLLSGFPDAFRDALDSVGTPAAREVWVRAAGNLASYQCLALASLR
jgi:serine/threonine-protein kinase HipA